MCSASHGWRKFYAHIGACEPILQALPATGFAASRAAIEETELLRLLRVAIDAAQQEENEQADAPPAEPRCVDVLEILRDGVVTREVRSDILGGLPERGSGSTCRATARRQRRPRC